MRLGGREFIDLFVNSDKVCVISKSYCPYCKKAIDALKNAGYSPKVEQIDQREDVDEIQDYCEELTGSRSVPRVFVSGRCIGGCDVTLKMLEDGSFKNLCSQK